VIEIVQTNNFEDRLLSGVVRTIVSEPVHLLDWDCAGNWSRGLPIHWTFAWTIVFGCFRL